MKKIDWKKLGILLLLIIGIIGIVLIITKSLNNSKKPTEEEITQAEKLTINNICNLTTGYATRYGGIDVLFTQDKVSFNDLSTANILNAAVRYAEEYLNAEISKAIVYQIEKQTPYRSSTYKFYTGENIRQAIKELFGIEYENKVSKTELNYGYNFTYLPEFDVYLMSKNEYYLEKEAEYNISYKIINTTKDKKTNNLKTEIAVAFTVKKGDKLLYLKEPNDEKSIYETEEKNTEIEENKTNEFNHYIITLKKVDNKYVFDSIEKK